jgi:hypothetical protein
MVSFTVPRMEEVLFPHLWSWFLPSFPSLRTHSLSMFPQMMIMLGAICAIIVVVIVSKYRWGCWWGEEVGRSWSLLPALPACLPAWGVGLLWLRYGDCCCGIIWFGRKGKDGELPWQISLPPARHCGEMAPPVLRKQGCAVCHWFGSKGNLGVGAPVAEIWMSSNLI